MNDGLLRVLGWIGLYGFIALIPVILALAEPLPITRDFLEEFSLMLGFLGFGILCLQCVITGRFRWLAAGIGFDNLLQFHKQSGVFALLLVFAHPLTMFIADLSYLEFYDPRANFPRAVALGFVTVAIIVLIASSLWRLTFRLSYERWRLLHGLLSLAIIFLGLGHIVMVNHYAEPIWKKAALVVFSGAAMYLVIHSRIIRPWRMRRRPYRIHEVRREPNDSWTLVIEPVGHPGLRHHPGQFVWLTLGDSPFSMQQHPFSLASSPFAERIELTIKELGDFTKGVKQVAPGTCAWLEGPYGSFRFDPTAAKAGVFIAGGVGITPIMSLLRAARDRRDACRYFLFFGNTAAEDIPFREELEEIAATIPLTVIHVLTDPPEDWNGEAGYIDRNTLSRHLPNDREGFRYYICGPAPLLDSAEQLLRNEGVRATAIFTERFDMV
jgi:predicted ferric reductase